MPYAHPDALVSSYWLAAHLADPHVRLVDSSFKLPGMPDYDKMFAIDVAEWKMEDVLGVHRGALIKLKTATSHKSGTGGRRKEMSA